MSGTAYDVTGEFFHACQEQFLGEKLTEIVNDPAHIGGSNIEFEEKAINIMAGKFGMGVGNHPSTIKLENWCESFLTNHKSNLSDITLTQSEIDGWFEALEEFRTFFLNNPALGGALYNKPIDYNLLPTTLLNLLKKSNCN
jgi:hypothetical protein